MAGRGSFAVLILAAVLLVGSSAFAMVQRDRRQDERDQHLANTVRQQAADLENYFERARSIILLTSRNPAFARFYEEPGSRLDKIERKGRAIREANDALVYLESLYPTSIGEACFIDYTGPENARVVRGERAAPEDLSPDESGNPFVKPTFTLRVGEVYQAAPYVSPDTGEWVISNSTIVPLPNHAIRTIVHFEVTVESFRQTAASTDEDVDIRVLDDHGYVVFDSRHPQKVGSPLGRPGDHRFGSLVRKDQSRSVTEVDGTRTAFTRLRRTMGNANDWIVVGTPVPGSALARDDSAPLLIVAAALLLMLGAVWNYVRVSRTLRRQREQLAEQERQLEKEQAQRGKLLSALVDATEEERKAIARELHDGPIQRLTTLDVKLETAILDLPERETSAAPVAEVQSLLREEIGGLRRLMSRLRPPVLDERGLSRALSDYASTITDSAGLDCSFVSNIEDRLEPTTETILYRVAQEALTNVLRHASATRVDMSLLGENGSVELQIRDDGMGFDLSQQDEFVHRGRFGLVGMRERVELAGGIWQIASSPEKGTSVRVVVSA
jgi:signal transduction histidine kinase